MLELRPICENCAIDLPPTLRDARICSYECTFCRNCVETILEYVCPNCGGGFVPRPIRSAQEWKKGVTLATNPAVQERKHRPVDSAVQRDLISRVVQIAFEKR